MPGSGDVNADFDNMAQKAARTNTVHDEVVNEIAAVGTAMRNIREAWDAPQGPQVFQQFWDQFQRDTTQLMAWLREYSGVLTNTGQEHQEADRMNAEQGRALGGNTGTQ